jgi:hypothetical protein
VFVSARASHIARCSSCCSRLQAPPLLLQAPLLRQAVLSTALSAALSVDLCMAHCSARRFTVLAVQPLVHLADVAQLALAHDGTQALLEHVVVENCETEPAGQVALWR